MQQWIRFVQRNGAVGFGFLIDAQPAGLSPQTAARDLPSDGADANALPHPPGTAATVADGALAADLACHRPGGQVQVCTGNLFTQWEPTELALPLADLALLCPVIPTKMIGLWNNFHALATKNGDADPAVPLYFLKAPNAWLAPGADIRAPAGYDGRVVYEGELGLVIGRRCHQVREEEADDYLFGLTCINDVTALSVLNEDPSFAQWTRAKGFDTFGPFGPCVVRGLDWSTLQIRTLVNGRERQNFPASDMILPPARIISVISRELTLEPGDIIACGTSVGVLPIKPGTRIDVVIDGVGTLSNRLA